MPGYWRLSQGFRRTESNPFLRFSAPGHFYSPLPDLALVEQHRDTLFNRAVRNVPGIDVAAEGQLALIEKLARYYDELPFKHQQTSGLRYYFRNPFFSYADAIVLYGMLRYFKPKRVIEIGSGFSSAVMLDTNERFLGQGTALTFVDPYPDRLLSLLSSEDRHRHEIIVDVVQNVPLARFAALQPGDVLFIDSSHVAKIGSDVVHLLTNVLPELSSGVLIHFHDIFWPFEYPEEWIREGRAWNENYILKAFLQFNSTFKILCFNSYLAIHHRQTIAESMPLFLENSGGSLWLEKM